MIVDEDVMLKLYRVNRALKASGMRELSDDELAEAAQDVQAEKTRQPRNAALPLLANRN